jgi:hypothetical protein
MEQILCEPVELTEFELDAVAGGTLFGSLFGNTTNNGVNGVLNANANGAGSEAAVSFVERINILEIDIHPTISVSNSVSI